MSSLVSRNIRIRGHRTSIRLEPELWEALETICTEQEEAMHTICDQVDATPRKGGFTSALRVYILNWFRQKDAIRDGGGVRQAA